MIKLPPPDSVENRMLLAIHQAVQAEFDKARDQIVKRAVEDFTAQVREIAAKTTMALMEDYSVERVGSHLVVRIKIEPVTPGGK